MNKIILISICFGLFLQLSVFAQQEKDVISKIAKVTVYAQGAQIENEASFELQQGKTMLNIKNLSPYINKESIKVEGDGSFTILNVQYRNDFINELQNSKEITALNNSIDSLKSKIDLENTWIQILNEKIDFQKANFSVNGKNQTITPEVYKSLNSIIGDNLEALHLKIMKKQRAIKEYTKDMEKLKNELNAVNSKTNLPSGIISILTDSKASRKASISITYLVDNAQWYPSYDLRFTGINKPLTINYKANITQNTGVDWKNVKLTLSTAKTNISAQIPELNPYYLQFYYPVFTRNYQYDMPAAAAVKTESYAVEKSAKMEDRQSVPATTLNKRETANEYTIDDNQTVLSDNKLNTIAFKESNLNALFEYQSVPKLNANVYLIGKIIDWSNEGLMDGEANVYMENSFVGNSMINTTQFSDTMDISFGIDNNISIKRKKLKDFSESQFLSSERKVTMAWKITVRNNKSYNIKTKISDQLPVSTVKEIQVDALELSGGKLNKEIGKIQWDIELKPAETKDIVLKYSVKYPKDKKLIVE